MIIRATSKLHNPCMISILVKLCNQQPLYIGQYDTDENGPLCRGRVYPDKMIGEKCFNLVLELREKCYICWLNDGN